MSEIKQMPLGSAPSNYGLEPAANRNLAVMAIMLQMFADTAELSCKKLDEEASKEITEICKEGFESFNKASVGCAPIQKVLTGVLYTLNALKEWRELGPLGSQDIVKVE